jgi:hypothetical protein
MKIQKILFGLALLSVAVNTIGATPLLATVEIEVLASEANPLIEPSANLPLVAEDDVFSSAYYDTLAILGTTNRCSEFFGGPSTIEVFNQLIAKMRKDYFSSDIGIRMSGVTSNIFNTATNRKYRLFKQVTLNGNGAFYRSKYLNSIQSLPGIGTYRSDTREARVLMLLHELGHIVTADDGKWLLPNDGNDEKLSRRNSMEIEKICGNEIAHLGRAERKTESAAKADKVKPH